MTATVRAKAAKKPARPTPPKGSSGFEPPRLSSSIAEEPERVTLFYIDDVPYSVTIRPGVNVGLRYLHLVRTSGELPAMDYLLEQLLGSEGYNALMGYDALTQAEFQNICSLAAGLTLGALELPKA